MNRLRILIALVCVLYFTASLAQSVVPATVPNTKGQITADIPQSPAGTVSLVGGDARIVQTGKQPRRAVVGDAVYEGDTLVTGKDSEVHLTMLDSGFLVLRPNTRLKIVSYKADGGDDDKALFRLFIGGLRSITGWIGKYNRKSYRVQTPTATIGIRGTDHETRYIPVGSSEGEPGTYDKVFAGGTTIQTGAGQADVLPDHAGYVSDQAGQHPLLLGRIPGFFHPGPNEDLINKKHVEIQQIIEQRRDERRKVIEQKRAALDAARAEIKVQYEKNKAAADEWKTAAEEQHQGTEKQFAALREREKALQEKQKAIQEMRKAIQEKVAGDLRKNGPLREQLMAVREVGNAVRNEYKEIQDARKVLYEKNMAATEAGKAAAAEQRRDNEGQLSALNEKGKALQEKLKALQEMRQTIQEKSTGVPTMNVNLSEQRKAIGEAAEAVGNGQKEIQGAQNAFFESNMAATEARMTAAAEQRRKNEQQLTALSEKEEALQEKQKANEETLEAIQGNSSGDTEKNKNLREMLKTVHEATEAVRKERKEIRDSRKTIHEKTMASIEERQRAAMEQLKVIRVKHQDMQDKSVDLQQERESMQEEIKTLYEQEQKRYREELKADRQRAIPDTHGETSQDP